jgi:hypothetical protein
MARRFAAFTIAATLGTVAVLGLAGCTAGPTGTTATQSGASQSGGSQTQDETGDGGQSTADACALVQETISEATDEFDSGAEDPAAVVDAMNAAAEKLSGVASQVTNDEVAALLPSLQDMFTQAGEVMAAVADGDMSKVEDLTELGTNFQETSETFQEICTP